MKTGVGNLGFSSPRRGGNTRRGFLETVSIDIPVSSLVWLATCRPEDAASFIRLLLAMTTNGRTPSPSISRAAVPPTVDLTGLASAGFVVMDDQTVTMPHLRKLAEKRVSNRDKKRRQRDNAGTTRGQRRDTPAPLSPPHTPPLTPIPIEVNNPTRTREVGWAKDLLDEATRMLGREPTGSETYKLCAKITELEAMEPFSVDGQIAKAGDVYVECLRYTTTTKGINSGVVPWLNYTEPVFDQCRRTGLGPGKIRKAKRGGVEIVDGEGGKFDDAVSRAFKGCKP